MTDFDRSKSLQDLEQQDWGEPTYHSSLVSTCHRLRRQPLNEFSVADLRIMIGQKIGLRFLVPLAAERLETEPLVEGYFYPGDLLGAVLMVDEAFWALQPELHHRMCGVVVRVKNLLPTLDEACGSTVRAVLEQASSMFRRSLTW